MKKKIVMTVGGFMLAGAVFAPSASADGIHPAFCGKKLIQPFWGARYDQVRVLTYWLSDGTRVQINAVIDNWRASKKKVHYDKVYC